MSAPENVPSHAPGPSEPKPAALVGEVAAVYVPLLLLLWFADGTTAMRALEALPAGLQIVVRIGVVMALALGLTLGLSRRDPQRWQNLGLAPRPLREVLGYGALGLGLAYLASTTCAIVFLIVSRTRLDALASQRGAVLELLSHIPIGLIVPVAIVVGIYEEIVFRGFILGRLRRALASTALSTGRRDAAAVVITAALFGALHVYQGGYGIFQTFGAGLALGVLVIWRGSLWPAIIAHASIDTIGLFAVRVVLPYLKHWLEQLPHQAH